MDNDNVTGIRAGDGDASTAQEAWNYGVPIVQEAVRAREEGRHEDALRHVLAAFVRMLSDDRKRHVDGFIVMLEWGFLVDAYAPARTAMAEARDAQVQRLLAGELTYGLARNEYLGPPSRFSLIADMNERLQDPQSTYALFVELDARMPGEARRAAFLALPAIVEAGDFALGERYLPDPLGSLDEVNRSAYEWPLSPFVPSSMRSFATLSNFARELRLRAAIVRGLGRAAEADALLAAGLSGLATDELRDWARKELADPGAILRESSALHMAYEDARNPRTPGH